MDISRCQLLGNAGRGSQFSRARGENLPPHSRITSSKALRLFRDLPRGFAAGEPCTASCPAPDTLSTMGQGLRAGGLRHSRGPCRDSIGRAPSKLGSYRPLRKGVTSVGVEAASKIQRRPPNIVPLFQGWGFKRQQILLTLKRVFRHASDHRPAGFSLRWQVLNYITHKAPDFLSGT